MKSALPNVAESVSSESMEQEKVVRRSLCGDKSNHKIISTKSE
jgi:hypothetical protein